MFRACCNNNIGQINELIVSGNNAWDYGLCGACKGGHLDLVNLMIEKGANWWNGGLCDACEGGHLDIANLMIEKGASDWIHVIKCSFDIQLNMFKNIDKVNKRQMIKESYILRNSLKLYTLIILDFLRIPKDLFTLVFQNL